MTDASMPRGPKAGRRAAFGFIFASSVMNAISFGIMIPVLPNLLKQLTGGDFAQASDWNVVFATTWGVMQFFSGPFLGLLSDRVGRRPILLVSLGGLAIDFLFMALAPTLGWLYLGRIINGLTAATFSTAGAYVADITPPEGRAKAFGMMGAAFGFGFLIGPVLGGLLAHYYSLRTPFFVAATLTGMNWLYGLLVLPESLPPERRVAAFNLKKANPIGSLIFLRQHAQLLLLAGINFLFLFAQNVLPTVFVLYAGYRYHWSILIMGLTMAGTGALSIFTQMVAVGPVVKRIGERGAMRVGLVSGILGFALYAYAPVGWVYVAAAPVFALINFVPAGVQGLMSRRVGPSEQGQLQGANQSLQGIASILGPMVFGTTFSLAVRYDARWHMPGLPIYIASATLVVALILAQRVEPAPQAAIQPVSA